MGVAHCPHCGQPLYTKDEKFGPFELYGVDDKLVLNYNGKKAPFTMSETIILGALLFANGRVATRSMLYDALYWDVPAGPDPKIIDVLVTKIRAKIRKYNYPFTIETSWGRGYSLTGVWHDSRPT